MPIVVRCGDSDPLNQGDLLRGVAFPITGVDGKLQADSQARFLLVVSRPCRAVRDEAVVVAPVHESKLDLSQVRQKMAAKAGEAEPITLDRMRRFLAGVRDGGQQSDSFYLGNLEEASANRFAADLGTLGTVRLPVEIEVRAKWVREHRMARLDGEFVQDLHARLSNTFSRLGFDDYRWFADPDLDIMITEGEREVATLRLALGEAERAAQEKQASGDTVPTKLTEHVANRRADVAEAEKQLKPYLDERDRRRPKGV